MYLLNLQFSLCQLSDLCHFLVVPFNSWRKYCRPPRTFAQFSLFVTEQRKTAQLVIWCVGHFMSLLSHDLESTMILNQWCFERKKNQQLLKKHCSKAVQIITTQTVKSLACVTSGSWNLQKDPEEKARAWANVEMVRSVGWSTRERGKVFH